MNYAATSKVQLYPETDLRSEYGWLDVQSGLTKILQGYGVLVGGMGFCGFLIATAAVQIAKGPPSKPALSGLWFFYLGMGLTSVIGPVGYGLIAMGKWRCLMHAPERFYCRWLMFGCMACLLAGPAMNIAACATGMDTSPQIKQGPQGFRDMKFTKLGGALQAVSGTISFSSLVLFTLFLRGVAKCFGDETQVRLADIYLIFFAIVFAGTVGLLFAPQLLLKPVVLLTVAGGWLLSFLGYLLLVARARGLIGRGLSALRPPTQPVQVQVQAPARAWPVL